MAALVLDANRARTPQREILSATVVIEDGRVAAIGARDEVSPPVQAPELNFPAMTLVPGFVDVHIHGAGGHDVMEGDVAALTAVAQTVARYGTKLATPPGRLLNAIFMGQAGGYFDGWRVSAGVTPTWSGIPDDEIGGMVQYNVVRFPERGESFVAPIGQFRVLATLSVKFSSSALVQYNGADDTFGANIRFRYNPREGTDVYLVYNDGLNTDRSDRAPYPPLSTGRALYLKCNYTFNF